MRILFLLCCIFILGICSDMQAQWVPADGPYEGSINCLIGNGTNLFAGTQGAGVYLSTNSGTQWTAVNTGLSELNDAVYSFAVKGADIFAGTPSGVFLSTNNGSVWTTSWLTNGDPVQALASMGSNIFAGLNEYGIFRSTNNGSTWIGTGFTGQHVQAFWVIGKVIARSFDVETGRRIDSAGIAVRALWHAP